METKDVLNLVINASDDKKAEDIIVLDMDQISLVADYFLICHGNNERQVQAIAKSIQETLNENGLHIKRLEGIEQARWVLVDIGDIVCHIFHKDERHYYNLERLWGDAPRVPFSIGQEG